MMSGEDSQDSGSQETQSGAGPYSQEKPVKVGDEMDVIITEISRRGDGVARVKGYVIFIPTGKQGQQARIKITMIRPSFAIAEIINSATPS